MLEETIEKYVMEMPTSKKAKTTIKIIVLNLMESRSPFFAFIIRNKNDAERAKRAAPIQTY